MFRSRFYFLVAIPLALANCGSEPEVQPPSPHGCFQTISAPTRPDPLTLIVSDLNEHGGFLGAAQPRQAVKISMPPASANTKFTITGPILSQENPGESRVLASNIEGRLSFAAPPDAGSYWLSVSEGDQARVVGELEVVAVPVALCGSGDVGPGGLVTAVWTGPGDIGDVVELYDPVEELILQVAPADGPSWEVNATKLQSPQMIGQYQVRYRKADGVVQVTTDVVVSLRRELGTLRSPSTARAGNTIVVQWIGPPRPGHIVRIVEAETNREVVSAAVRDGGFNAGSVEVIAPGPGNYRVEYAKPEGGPAGGSQNLVVTNPEA